MNLITAKGYGMVNLLSPKEHPTHHTHTHTSPLDCRLNPSGGCQLYSARAIQENSFMANPITSEDSTEEIWKQRSK